MNVKSFSVGAWPSVIHLVVIDLEGGEGGEPDATGPTPTPTPTPKQDEREDV